VTEVELELLLLDLFARRGARRDVVLCYRNRKDVEIPCQNARVRNSTV